MKKKIEVKQEKVEPEIKLEKLRLLCRKCGKEWIGERPLGYLVRYRKNNNYLVNRKDEKKKYFKCPKCGSRSKIARLPVVDVMKLKSKKHARKMNDGIEYLLAKRDIIKVAKRDIIEVKEVG